jgi:hypothetical protein
VRVKSREAGEGEEQDTETVFVFNHRNYSDTS